MNENQFHFVGLKNITGKDFSVIVKKYHHYYLEMVNCKEFFFSTKIYFEKTEENAPENGDSFREIFIGFERIRGEI